jgi:hypothetical protein
MRSLKSELAKLTDSIEFQVRETHAPSSSSLKSGKWQTALRLSQTHRHFALKFALSSTASWILRWFG